MSKGSRAAVLAASLTALALVPATAGAATVPMRGVVSGSPYGASGGQMAVPVLFSKMTARNAGLKSPVGVIVMTRNQKVKLPRGTGYAIPVELRIGDRFKGFGVVGSLQKKVFYPRVVFPKATVYFRSKELSLAELSAAILSLQKAMADLQNQVNVLGGITMKGFQDVYAQLADLRKQLAALQALNIPNYQAAIDALNKRLDDLIASLPDMTSYVKLGDLTALLAGYATKGYVDGQVAALQAQITTLNSTVTNLTGRLDTVCSAIKGATVTLDPDAGGLLPPVTAPVTLPGVGSACP
jgi:chaperonin cofactor prefoldin